MIGIFVMLYVVYMLVGNTSKPKATNEVILYWSKDCPHCKKVEDYLKTHPAIEKKIKIVQREVSSQESLNDWREKIEICKLDPLNPIGVPFLYFKGQCINGDQPIINFLNKKTS